MKASASGLQKFIKGRWYSEDFPGGTPHFQLSLLLKDFAVFVLIPTFAIISFKSCENAFSSDKKKKTKNEDGRQQQERSTQHSQIVEFESKGRGNGVGVSVRAPGTLVKVHLLNSVEVYSNAPVFAQVVDEGLGHKILGATLIGDATSDPNFERINISFRLLRIPRNHSTAFAIAARALSLDGTLGLNATKKEGYFARSAISAAGIASSDDSGHSDSSTLKDIIVKALGSSLKQELNSDQQIARNRSQVLTLKPATEFFVELTDYFPAKK